MLKIRATICCFGLSLVCLGIWLGAGLARAADSAGDAAVAAAKHKPAKPAKKELSPATIRGVAAQINRLVEENRRIRQLMDEEERRNQEQIKNLQDQLKAIQTAQRQTPPVSKTEVESIVKTQLAEEAPTSFRGLLDNYWGEHRFVLGGGAWGSYQWDRQAGIQGAPGGVNTVNSFNFGTELVPLYRLNDWIGMEGMIDINLPSSGGADVSLEEYNIFLYLNDYVELVVGKFMLPFGDYMEDVSAPWINRFVTNPLPYGNAMMVPSADLGVEARGGVQWGKAGQDLNYTVWASNGPSFMMSPSAIPGDMLNDATNATTATNGKGFGGRFRAYLLPVDSNLGDLELGASTYDGKWQNGLWFTSWGVDTSYQLANLEFRGEYLETHRQMPAGMVTDNRQGWYVQAGYQLNGVAQMLKLSPSLAAAMGRLEPSIRYSGVNQRAVVLDEVPSPGDFIGATTFQPHAREVALGVDYWINPSVVWKLEYDMELPEAGGYNISAMGKMPAGMPTGATYNDRALLTQLAVWF